MGGRGVQGTVPHPASATRSNEDGGAQGSGLIEVSPQGGAEGLVFYRGTRVSIRYPWHWHDELHLCAYTAGSGHVGYRGVEERVEAGDLLFTPAGEMHHNWVAEGAGVSFRSVYIPLPVLRAAARQVLGRRAAPPDFLETRSRHAGLVRSYLRMHRAMEHSATRLRREGLLIEFLRVLVTDTPGRHRAERPNGGERQAIRRAREYIHAHQAESIALADLSRVAALSPFHLHRVFARETGLPPHGYLIQVRVNRARELLRRGLAPADVALLTGFADQSHLTRHFRRRVGITPGRFRAETGRGDAPAPT